MQDNTQDKDFEYDISKDREFDPVKKQIGGKEAERVVWSTYSLNKAVEALKQGLPLKANPFIGKNTKLLKADLVYKRTEEEIDDYIKCMQDPVYFATKCYLKNPAGGFSPVELRDYQINYLKHLQTHPFSIMLSCRQSGKCNSLISNQLYKFDKQKIEALNKENKIIFYSQIDYLLKKYYFYINGDYIFIELPMFELYNLYCKQTSIWKCKYQLYKIIYRLTYGRNKRNEEKKET